MDDMVVGGACDVRDGLPCRQRFVNVLVWSWGRGQFCISMMTIPPEKQSLPDLSRPSENGAEWVKAAAR